MAWDTAIYTAWATSDRPAPADFNRIEGNLLYLKGIVTATVSQAGKDIVTWTADHSWNGMVGRETISENGSLFDLLYLSAAGYAKAKAAGTTYPVSALRLETGTGVKSILKKGFVRDLSWSWTKGQLLWLSPATAGLITSTKPTTSGNIIQCVGYAAESNVIYFCPDLVWGEVL